MVRSYVEVRRKILIKRVYLGNPDGRRPFGRPRTRWKDHVIKDMNRIGETIEETNDRVK